MGIIGTTYTPNVAKAIYEGKEKGSNWTTLGQKHGIDRRTAKRWRDKYVKDSLSKGFTGPTKLSEDPLFNTERFIPFSAEGNMIVTADWHIPLHSPKMVNYVIEKGHREGIKVLVIGGDYWDMTSYSHYPPHQREAPFVLEREKGVEVADALADTFDEIYVFWGNHDHRFLRQNEFAFSFQFGMQMLLEPIGKEKLSKFNFSDLDYMLLNQGDRTYRFSHQKNFSKIPLTVPRQLAQKYHCSIITGHSHHCAQGVALDGWNHIFEVGGLFDKSLTEYIQKTTTHHEWVPGFLMFKDTVPTLFSPVFGNL